MIKNNGKLLLLFLLGSLVILATGCGGSGGQSNSGANQGKVTSILVDSATVLVGGGKYQFVATVLNENAKEMFGLKVAWAVDDSTLGTIDSTGKFTANNKIGTCNVTCMVGGKSKTVPVTVRKIQEPGAQIIDDLASFGTARKTIFNPKLLDILKKTKQNIIPHLGSIESAWHFIFKFSYNPFLLRYIFTRNPGAISAQSQAVTIISKLNTGTWDVTFTDYVDWRATYRRKVDGENDLVNVTISSTKDAALSYQLTLKYPTANLFSLTAASFTTSGTLVDRQLDASTFNGTVNIDLHGKNTNYKGDISGAMEYKFKDGSNNYLNLQGELGLCFNVSQENYLSGTMATADLTISGELRLKFVANSHQKSGVFPESVTLKGYMVGKDSEPIKLDGKVAFAASNGADYDADKEWSVTNYLKGNAEFSGTIVINNNYQLAASLTLQSLSAQLYKLDYQFRLSSGGTPRTLTLTLRNTDTTHLEFVGSSDYGQTELKINLAFKSDLSFDSDKWSVANWADREGTKLGTLANKTEIADVIRSKLGIRFYYSGLLYKEILII